MRGLKGKPDQSPTDKNDIRKKENAIEHLRCYAKNGFFDLNQKVIDALTSKKTGFVRPCIAQK
ncbi:MAG: hypothetical protein WAM14_18715 [Candidatus Nitrosopolaris sp.]